MPALSTPTTTNAQARPAQSKIHVAENITADLCPFSGVITLSESSGPDRTETICLGADDMPRLFEVLRYLADQAAKINSWHDDEPIVDKPPTRINANAERQRRYRARKRGESVTHVARHRNASAATNTVTGDRNAKPARQ